MNLLTQDGSIAKDDEDSDDNAPLAPRRRKGSLASRSRAAPKTSDTRAHATDTDDDDDDAPLKHRRLSRDAVNAKVARNRRRKRPSPDATVDSADDAPVRTHRPARGAGTTAKRRRMLDDSDTSDGKGGGDVTKSKATTAAFTNTITDTYAPTADSDDGVIVVGQSKRPGSRTMRLSDSDDSDDNPLGGKNRAGNSIDNVAGLDDDVLSDAFSTSEDSADDIGVRVCLCVSVDRSAWMDSIAVCCCQWVVITLCSSMLCHGC